MWISACESGYVPYFIYWTLEFHVIFTCFELFFFLSFFFCHPFKNVITLLSSRAILEQRVGCIWPVGHCLPTPDLEQFCSLQTKEQSSLPHNSAVSSSQQDWRPVEKRRFPQGKAVCYPCRILHSWWPDKHGPELELRMIFLLLFHESTFNDNISSWCFSYKSTDYAWNWCTLFHHELIW